MTWTPSAKPTRWVRLIRAQTLDFSNVAAKFSIPKVSARAHLTRNFLPDLGGLATHKV